MAYYTKNHKQVKYQNFWNVEYFRNIPKFDFRL